jgi:hypothetical protein
MTASESLTREQRKALPSDLFAFPQTRELPLHDARHVRMGWSQVGMVSGFTPRDRSEARARILARAHTLGMDEEIQAWSVRTVEFALEGLSLEVPEQEGHPNKMPFHGVLTRLDEASDKPPGGANGKRTLISKPVAEAALSSLLAMGVDCNLALDGHDPQRKIGVITEATIQGNAIQIAGFLYAKDFPDECAEIKRRKDVLGFSYECDVCVADPDSDPWVITWCVFTGAAILQKDKAAYQSTSLAAEAEEEAMTPEQLKALTDSIDGLGKKIEAVSGDVAKLKAGSLGGPIIDQVRPHVEACNACAASMRAAGVGTHPDNGHAVVLERVAHHMAACAAAGTVPHSFSSHMYAASDKGSGGDQAKAIETLSGTVNGLKDGLESIKTMVKDIQAKAADGVKPPERRTLSAEVLQFLSKNGIAAQTDDGKPKTYTTVQIDELLTKAGITGQEKIARKLTLRAAGLLQDAAA